ncbi:cAMP-dependent protein kinase catalytic subunit, putative [Pediculus humanus corporis]|uniref:cGMP-dependent protein kinase n=1 Tax=Pediculus humanus subsp. corporis TaxID=121224 RepID=E0V9I6_PEDHC|nr:cAMP-dependent protein kinase catalytic subunit, putative [Pediculus humanus corporis]EEB10042.1 cAMP-dependent protein kinase catalytic subunit, putative [Pediculus humanus corporis]
MTNVFESSNILKMEEKKDENQNIIFLKCCAVKKMDVGKPKRTPGKPLIKNTINKKKEGVSGNSSVTKKLEKASDIKLPKYEKDLKTIEFIKDSIRGNEFLKDGLFASPNIIKAVVDAMYIKSVPANEYIIREGEVGFHMYVVAKGSIDVFKGDVKVNTLGPKKVFGELALLYNSKRNATILANTDCDFWVLDRKIFLQIMKKSGMQMTENRVKFLRSVPLLSSLNTEVLVKMTDLLKLRTYAAGSVILKQGDEGSLFYIITGGTVSVTITQPDGTVKQGPILKTGDFFGEKALLKDEKRAATVIAQEPGVECLTLDRIHFIEYLGGLQEVRDANFDKKFSLEKNDASGIIIINKILKKIFFVLYLKHLNCLTEFSHLLLDDLEIIGTIGVGAFGRVEFVKCKNDKNIVFALKCVKKIDVVALGQEQHMHNEKENMMMCRSPFIVRLYNTYKSSKYVYFLMEFCQGGDVWSLLQKKKFFDESLARFITGCMVEAFEYLHARGIAYRDLKPENVIFDAKGYAKLADFGFSKKLKPTEKTWTFAGTPEYVAPEIILNEGHNRAVDYWTLGIFIHELLVGKPPFRGHNHSQTYTLILKGIDSVLFPRLISKTAQILIKKLCKRAPAERLGFQREGVTDIKKHRWFQNFNWEALEKTLLVSPHVPKLKGTTDLSYFDKYPKDKEIPPDEFGDWDSEF